MCVRPATSSQCRVSCRTDSPDASRSAWRWASYSMARPSERSELRFLISQRVPRSSVPSRRTDTLASTRSEPSSIFPSLTPVATRIDAQLGDVPPRLLGAAHVGPRHDLQQRDAGAVVVDERVLGAVDATVAADVGGLAGVLLQVRPLDADDVPVGQLEVAVGHDRLVVLGDLEVLRHVRIEVVLPGEDGAADVGADRAAEADRPLDGALVDHRQRAGQAEGDRVDVRVGLVAEPVRRTREHLRGGRQLGVDLEAAHQLPAGAVGRGDHERVGAVGDGDHVAHRVDGGHQAAPPSDTTWPVPPAPAAAAAWVAPSPPARRPPGT